LRTSFPPEAERENITKGLSEVIESFGEPCGGEIP
jgi:hypothetical protein